MMNIKQKLFDSKIKYNSAEIPLDILIAIVIMIICMFSYYNYQKNEELKRRITKAQNDCLTLAEAIKKYNSLEMDIVKDYHMKEIRGKYITGIDTLKDPWGQVYKQDYKKRIAYSSGPNGIDFDDDDISVKY